MLITEFIAALDTVIPLSTAGYEKDAVGLQVGLPKPTELRRALFCYEVTLSVVEEAAKKGANLIIAFHPLIFPVLRSVTEETRTGALVRELIKNDIALYILHTAFDAHPEFGTSRLMAEALGLQNLSILSPNRPNPIFGMGVVGEWKKPQSLDAILESVKATFGEGNTHYVVRSNTAIRTDFKRVAMVGGAGMDFYGQALAAGADCFITADVRYHDFYRAQHDNVLLIDAGHSETERFVAAGMLRAGEAALQVLNLHKESNQKVRESEDLLIISEQEPNAVRYF